MSGKQQSSKRTLAKKVTSFNMYLDQATQIQAIMEATGADKDAPVLRTLLDEALAARRRRAAGYDDVDRQKSANEFSRAVQTLQTLILKAIALGEKTLSVEAFTLQLLQETFAEARAGKELIWTELSAARMLNEGLTPETIAARLEIVSLKSRSAAYEIAHGLIKDAKTASSQLLESKAPSPQDGSIDIEIDDSQPMLF